MVTDCRRNATRFAVVTGCEIVCMTAVVLHIPLVHHGRLCPDPSVLDQATFGVVESDSAMVRP
jgi:hypothetical protein